MTPEDDIARSLPRPPLPAPARREAAIEAALRHFDGEPASSPDSARPAPSASWWPQFDRPQSAMLASALLVALIGVPVAVNIMDQQAGVDGGDPRERAADGSPASPPAVAIADRDQAPGPVQPPAPLARTESLSAAKPTADLDSNMAPVPFELAEAPSPPATAPAAIVGETATREVKRNAESGLADAMTTRADQAKARGAQLAARAPSRETDDGDIVVTGVRQALSESEIRTAGAAAKSTSRGDWNACTVDDPGRNLGACRGLVNSAAPGAAGRSAAHIADGLGFAWQGEFERAVAAFDKAIEVAPRSSSAYLNRGLAYRRLGRLDLAIADLDRAVRYGASARAHYQRSLLLRQQGDSRRADADAKRAADLDPSYTGLAKSGQR